MNNKKRKNKFAKELRKTLHIDFITAMKIAKVFQREDFPNLMSYDIADEVFSILEKGGFSPRKIYTMETWADSDTSIYPEILINGLRVSPYKDLPLWDGRM